MTQSPVETLELVEERPATVRLIAKMPAVIELGKAPSWTLN